MHDRGAARGGSSDSARRRPHLGTPRACASRCSVHRRGPPQGRLPAALASYDVLLELERVGDARLRPYELRKTTLFAQYNLPRLIDRLESAAYVAGQASEDVGRGQILTIANTGRAMHRKIWPVYASAIEVTVGLYLSDAEAQTLGGLLGRLFDARS